MSPREEESIEIKVARIEERVSSDRRNHAIHFQNLDSKFDDMNNTLKDFLAQSEIARLQTEEVIRKAIEENKKSLTDYKKKMRYWEIFQEWKSAPFWVFMALIAAAVREDLAVFLNAAIDKLIGK